MPLSGECAVGNATISYCHLDHPGGSIGYRLECPTTSLAFITDTRAEITANYVDFIRDVDLLIHECNFPQGYDELAKLTGHSCIGPVCEVAKKANVGRLVLIHMNPLAAGEDPVDLPFGRSIFKNCDVAQDGQRIEL